jgi:hypothetical protein
MVPDHTYLMRSTHSNLSRSHQQSWAGPLLPRKRASDKFHSTSAYRFVGLYPVSLPRLPLKKWGQSQPSVDGRLLGLPDPYIRHEISTFNTCSRGPTHRSLTNIDGCYNLGGAGFHITLSDLPSRRSSAFHLRAPPGLKLSNLNISLKWKWCEAPVTDQWSFDHSASTEIYIYAYQLLTSSKY